MLVIAALCACLCAKQRLIEFSGKIGDWMCSLHFSSLLSFFSVENMYDVFMNIRDDEAEHCKTMKTCQTHGSLRSPHTVYSENATTDDDFGCIVPNTDCEGIVDCVKKSFTSQPWTKSSRQIWSIRAFVVHSIQI